MINNNPLFSWICSPFPVPCPGGHFELPLTSLCSSHLVQREQAFQPRLHFFIPLSTMHYSTSWRCLSLLVYFLLFRFYCATALPYPMLDETCTSQISDDKNLDRRSSIPSLSISSPCNGVLSSAALRPIAAPTSADPVPTSISNNPVANPSPTSIGANSAALSAPTSGPPVPQHSSVLSSISNAPVPVLLQQVAFTPPGREVKVLPVGISIVGGSFSILLGIVLAATVQRFRDRRNFRRRKLAESGAEMGYGGIPKGS